MSGKCRKWARISATGVSFVQTMCRRNREGEARIRVRHFWQTCVSLCHQQLYHQRRRSQFPSRFHWHWLLEALSAPNRKSSEPFFSSSTNRQKSNITRSTSSLSVITDTVFWCVSFVASPLGPKVEPFKFTLTNLLLGEAHRNSCGGFQS